MIVSLLVYLLHLFVLLLIVRAVLSWVSFSSTGVLGKIERVISSVTEPVLAPIRRLLPTVGVGNVGFDLSNLVAFLLIEFILIPVLVRL